MLLDWTNRMKIVISTAQSLPFLHHIRRLSHGNVKSTNLLLDSSGNVLLADLSLAFGASQSVSARHTEGTKPSQWADVYSFGVLLLELPIGRSLVTPPKEGGVDLPRWVQSVVGEEWTSDVFDLELMCYKNIEEMVGTLQIGLSCTFVSPNQQPKMAHAVKLMEDVRGHGTVEP